MAWFEMPKNANQGDYAVVSPQEVAVKKLVPNSIWKATVQVGDTVDVAFIDGAGLLITSNNPGIIKVPISETVNGNVRTLTIEGSRVGFTMLDVSVLPGKGSESLQVEVVAPTPAPTIPDVITLEQPSVALNSHDTPTTYDMQFNYVISPSTSAQDIIDKVRAHGRIKHLAISSHGYANANGTYKLDIGTGFDGSNTGLFSQLHSDSVKVGVLWFAGCAACGSQQAKDDCKARAIAAKSYLVGPVMFMSNPPGSKGKLHLIRGQIDMRSRFMPVVFTPTGGNIAWVNFLSMGSRLGFTL